jgi:hypothetical protein
MVILVLSSCCVSGAFVIYPSILSSAANTPTSGNARSSLPRSSTHFHPYSCRWSSHRHSQPSSCPTGGHITTWLHDDESGNGRAASSRRGKFFFRKLLFILLYSLLRQLRQIFGRQTTWDSGRICVSSCRFFFPSPRVQQVATSLPDYTMTNQATEEQQARDAVSFFFVSFYLYYCTNCCVSCVKFLDDKQHGTRGASASRVAGFLLHYLVFNSSHHLTEMGRVQQRNFMYGASELLT